MIRFVGEERLSFIKLLENRVLIEVLIFLDIFSKSHAHTHPKQNLTPSAYDPMSFKTKLFYQNFKWRV